MERFREKFKDNIIIVICILFMLQDFLMIINSKMAFIDEIVFLFLFFIYLLKIFYNKKILKREAKSIFFAFIIIIIGCLGNLIFKYQTNAVPILRDIYNTFKVFWIFYASYSFMEINVHKEEIIKKLAKFVRILVLFATICRIVSCFVDIGMSEGEIRYGIKSFSFIYDNPGVFSMYVYMYILVLTMDLKYSINKKDRNYKLFFILMCLFIWAMTLRSKAFAYIAIYIILYYYLLSEVKIKFKLNFWHIILAILIILPFTYDKIIYYFGTNSQTARRALLENSIIIAYESFPIGSGFATFGTDMAYKYYSVLYKKLGLNTVFGLSEEFGAFASDNYWPAILAQFGVLGTLIMVCFICKFYFDLFRLYKKRNTQCKNVLFCLLFVTCITVFSSVATATYFHYTTMALFFMLPLLFKNENVINKKEKYNDEKVLKENKGIIK